MEIKIESATKHWQQDKFTAATTNTEHICNKDGDVDEADALRSHLAKVTSEKESLIIDNNRLHADVKKLQETLRECQDSVPITQKEQPGHHKYGNTCNNMNESVELNQLELSLNEANDKISELLKVKERFAEVDTEKTNLANNLSELEEEVDVLSFQTRTATACSMIPLVILVFAVIVAYLPQFSSLFGTVD
jgi:chromosome segregation ATPase